jgi:hypothetical protein
MRLLGGRIDFRANLAFSFRRYTVWWIILLITATFDGLTTVAFVQSLGVAYEANAVARFFINVFGAGTGVLMNKLLQVLAVAGIAGLHRRLGNLFLLVIIVLNCWAVVINSQPALPGAVERAKPATGRCYSYCSSSYCSSS